MIELIERNANLVEVREVNSPKYNFVELLPEILEANLPEPPYVLVHTGKRPACLRPGCDSPECRNCHCDGEECSE